MSSSSNTGEKRRRGIVVGTAPNGYTVVWASHRMRRTPAKVTRQLAFLATGKSTTAGGR